MVRDFRKAQLRSVEQLALGPFSNSPGRPSQTLSQLELDGDPIDPIGGAGALIGYARVSARDQKLDRQVDALTAAGCHRIFEERLSGKNTDRPELAKCLDYLRPGDTIVVLEL